MIGTSGRREIYVNLNGGGPDGISLVAGTAGQFHAVLEGNNTLRNNSIGIYLRPFVSGKQNVRISENVFEDNTFAGVAMSISNDAVTDLGINNISLWITSIP